MDGRVNILQIVDVILHTRELRRIIQQSLHLRFGATISQLQVVQHGIILLREPLVGILDGFHVSAHLIGIIRHIHHGHIRDLSRFCRIPGNTLQQRSRKAGHVLHILVGRHTSRLIGIVCVINDCLGAVLEQSFHSAYVLLQTCHGIQRRFRQPAKSRCDSGNCSPQDRHSAFCQAPNLFDPG